MGESAFNFHCVENFGLLFSSFPQSVLCETQLIFQQCCDKSMGSLVYNTAVYAILHSAAKIQALR